MAKYLLEDLLQEITIKTTRNNEYEVLTSSQSGIVRQIDYFNKQVASQDNVGYKVIKKGQFTYRAMSDTGLFYINRLDDFDIGIVSPAYPVFEIKSQVISSNYLKLYFESNDFQNQIANLATGSTRLALKFSKLKKLEILVPSLEEQNAIIDKINSIKILLNKSQEVINLYDELIKSRYFEMFGALSDEKFKIKRLDEICELIKDGTHQTPTYTEDKINGFTFVSSKDVTSGKIDWENTKRIPRELHEELYKSIAPRKNDLLVAKNGTIGCCALVEEDRIFDIYVSVALLRQKEMNPIFFKELISSLDTQNQFFNSLKGVGVPNLHLGEIRKTRVLCPPIELQNKFAEFVSLIDSSKKLCEQRIIYYKELLNKEMDKYFN